MLVENGSIVRTQLIQNLQNKISDVPASIVGDAVDGIFRGLTEAIASGKRIEVRGFGSFTTKVIPPYIARNPKTGDSVRVPTRCKVVFKPSRHLQDYYLKPGK